jgi:hypothetical protein
MQRDLFRYQFKEETDTQWYEYVNNIVSLSAIEKYFYDKNSGLVNSPTDWRNTQVGLARNERYGGVYTGFSVPMSFTFAAIAILKYVYARDGYEGTVIFIIEKLNNNWEYEVLYKGELDLSQCENSDFTGENGIYFKTNISESGLVETLKNKEGVPVEIEFDNDAVTINHDGIKLKTSSTWIAGGQSPITYNYNVNERLFPDAYFASTETSPYFQNFYNPNSQVLHQTITDPNKYLFITFLNLTCSIELEFDIDLSLSGSVVSPCQFFIRLTQIPYPVPGGSFTAINHNVYAYAGGASTIPVGVTTNIKGSVVIPNDVFPLSTMNKLQINVSNGSSNPNQFIQVKINSLKLKINILSRLPSSDIKAFQYHKFLEKLFTKAIGGGVGVVSNYLRDQHTDGSALSINDNLGNSPKFTTVTSGSAVRGLAGAKIKTSISDAFQDMRRWGLGLGVEGNNIRIERWPYFFQKNNIIFMLDAIKNFKYTNANSYLANMIKTGYPNQTFDDLNGLDDYNTESAWNIQTLRIIKELNWASGWYASIYALEYARAIGLAKKETTDTQYDDQVYLMEIADTAVSGKFPLRRDFSATNFVNGVIYPDTIYNVGISPAKTPRYNRELLLSMMYGKLRNNNTPMIWSPQPPGDKNKSLIHYYNNGAARPDTIAENGNITPQDLLLDHNGNAAGALFQPTMFEYEAVVPSNILDIIKNDPQKRYGVIGFPYKGQIFYNFVGDIALRPATNDLYKITGLSSPDNDLNKL